MKLYMIYNKVDGRVAGYSDCLNPISDKFEKLEYNATDEEYKKLQQNYLAKIIDKKLILEPSPYNLSEEKREKARLAKEKLIEKGDKITTKELRDLLLQII